MTEAFLKELKGLEFDSLTAREAAELRTLLKEAVDKSDAWFAEMAERFGYPVPKYTLPVKADKPGGGRPPEVRSPPNATAPVKPSPRRRGRPVPNLKVDFKVKQKPPPIKVGGADAEDGPQPAEIFQGGYVSKEGPQGQAQLPEGHPRRNLHRESSVSPEVDMSDFAEVEAALRSGKKPTDLFQ